MAAKKKTEAAVRKDSVGEQIISAGFEIGFDPPSVGINWVCFKQFIVRSSLLLAIVITAVTIIWTYRELGLFCITVREA